MNGLVSQPTKLISSPDASIFWCFQVIEAPMKSLVGLQNTNETPINSPMKHQLSGGVFVGTGDVWTNPPSVLSSIFSFLSATEVTS